MSQTLDYETKADTNDISHYEDKRDIGDVSHLENKAADGIISDSFGQYINDAAAATSHQKQQSVFSAIRMYPKGVLFSLIFSTAIIMEGYDFSLLANFYAQPAFTQRFGIYDPGSDSFQIPTVWQTGIGAGGQAGQILGLQVTGWLTDKFGYRYTMLIALLAITSLLFMQFFATGLPMLLAAQILLGFPFGTFQTTTVAYASELMPVALRPFLTTYVNLCWVIGQIIAAGVLRSFTGNPTEWAYKIPFAIQWIWPVPIMIGIVFAPESPWYLVRKGRLAAAEAVMMKITSRAHYTHDDAKKAVAMMVHTDAMEKEAVSGVTFRDCFKGTNLRRTEIACVAWLIQNVCGSAFMGFATYFLVQAGLTSETASTLNVCLYIIGAMGTILSWPLMRVVGRRPIYFWGQIVMAALMLIIGILGSVTAKGSSAAYGIGALLLIFTGVYDLTVGPVCYCLVAEISSTRLRAKTVVLARNVYNLCGLVISVLNPQMLNPTAWNLGARAAYLWAATGSIAIVWTYFRLPEPMNRTFGEMDVLFEDRVSARKFASTEVDEFRAAERDAQYAGLGGGVVH